MHNMAPTFDSVGAYSLWLHCAARRSFLPRNTELEDLPFIFYMSRVGRKVTGNSPIN